MNDFIKHFLRHNSKEVLAKSLTHCHSENLHSIMLLDSPGKIIRMFIAEPGHNLWKNDAPYIAEQQSIAFHSHHCDLYLKCVYGEFINRSLTKGDRESIPSYKFISQIKTNNGAFERIGSKRVGFARNDRMWNGCGIYLAAKEIHTVVVPKNEWAAWVVFEGKEDKNYDPTCYSFSDLTKVNFSKLYQKMSKSKLNTLLKGVDIL